MLKWLFHGSDSDNNANVNSTKHLSVHAQRMAKTEPFSWLTEMYDKQADFTEDVFHLIILSFVRSETILFERNHQFPIHMEKLIINYCVWTLPELLDYCKQMISNVGDGFDTFAIFRVNPTADSYTNIRDEIFHQRNFFNNESFTNEICAKIDDNPAIFSKILKDYFRFSEICNENEWGLIGCIPFDEVRNLMTLGFVPKDCANLIHEYLPTIEKRFFWWLCDFAMEIYNHRLRNQWNIGSLGIVLGGLVFGKKSSFEDTEIETVLSRSPVYNQFVSSCIRYRIQCFNLRQ